jgi:hypothetical protein
MATRALGDPLLLRCHAGARGKIGGDLDVVGKRQNGRFIETAGLCYSRHCRGGRPSHPVEAECSAAVGNDRYGICPIGERVDLCVPKTSSALNW